MNNKILAPLTLTACWLAGVAITQAASAPKKVPGEKWKQTISMQAAGMSLPARTLEMCLPKGKEQEAASRPQQEQGNCSIYDTKQSGNTFSAKMRCTGKDAMEGDIETVNHGADHISGTTRMRGKDMEMTMKFDTQRLGTACEALDYSDYVPPAPPVAASVDMCAAQGEQIGKDSLAGKVGLFVGASAPCGQHAARRKFCDAVQSPAGFQSLESSERAMSGATADGGVDAAALKPLTTSVQACGFGTGQDGVDRLRVRLVPVAETGGQWGYVAAYGDDAALRRMIETGRRECSGRSFTSASNARFSGLCMTYGAALARGDLAALREIAAGGFDPGPGRSGGEGASGSAMSRSAGTNAAPAAGSAEPGQAPGATDGGEPAGAKDKAKDAVEAGKRALRGIFGR
jgi:hypothetical protein